MPFEGSCFTLDRTPREGPTDACAALGATNSEIAHRLPNLTARGAGRVARGIADRLNAEAAVARIRRHRRIERMRYY